MAEPKTLSFHEMEIDDRLLKAIAKLGWLEPTLIQEKAIPLLLEGKDVLVRARTGSGKTAAFAIPVIQKVLNLKLGSSEQQTRALVLAPSKELCQQLTKNFRELTLKCSRDVTCVDISQQMDVKHQKPLLVERPDVVIATPSRALVHLKANTLKLDESLEMLIIDEADLVLTFGYEKDVKKVLKFLPKVYQAILASATLTEEVVQLKQLVLHNPVILKLQEPDIAPPTQLAHFYVSAEEEEKAVILYALLKLGLVKGKTIIFVNTVDRCYKLKLYLEQFAIPTCVLNSELPATIRCHSVNQFNQGIYDIIIASDENILEDPEQADSKKSKRSKDQESGVARGIDFQFVSNVINFDFPKTINSYVHRAGRTARGNNDGTALNFVSIKEQALLEAVEDHLKTSFDEDENQTMIKSYEFRIEEVEGFRYRARDAWKAVTKIAIREARLKEIKKEVLNSNKLKVYFEDNPRDLQCLRHDKALHTVKIQPHLAHVPDYIVPESIKRMGLIPNERKRKTTYGPPISKGKARFQARQDDPLMSLQFTGLRNKRKKHNSSNK